MRSLLIALAGLALLVVAALVVAPRFIDWNQYKPEIAALAARATGRSLTIDGAVGFSLLPTPTLSAAGVRVGAAPGETGELMRLKSLDARIAFGPLLLGRVAVESIALVEPSLVIDADAPLPSLGDASLEDRFSFARVIVVDGTIEWRAAGTPASAPQRIERINAEITAPPRDGAAPLEPLRVSGDAAWRGLFWRFDLSAGRLGDAVPVSLSLGLRGGGATMRVSGTASWNAPETLLIGRLRAEAIRLPELIGALGYEDALPVPLGQAATAEAALKITHRRIALDNLTLTLGDDMRAGGAAGLALDALGRFDATLAINRLDLDRWTARLPPAARPPSALPAPPPPVLRGALALTVDALLWRGGVIRQARLDGVLGPESLTIKQAAAQLPGGSDMSLFGQVTLGAAPRFDGQLEAGADNLRSLFVWLKLDANAIPADRLRRVSAIAGLSITRDALELANLDLRFDASRLTGGLIVTLGDRPAVGANLRLDRINLEGYLPRTVGARAAADQAPPPLAWLTALDANLQLQIEHLAYDTVPLDGVLIDATLARGTLSLHELSVASAAGLRASITGTIGRAAWPAELALTARAEADDPSRLFQLLGDDLATPALGPLAATLTANGPLDHLRLVFDAGVADGKLRVASEDANLLAPGGSLTLGLSGVRADAIAGALLRATPVSGRLDLEATVTAAPTLLTGTGRLSLRDATLEGFDLGAVAMTGGLTGAALARQVEQDLSDGRTAVTTLDGDIALRGATLATDGLTGRGAAGQVTLRGNLDLAARQLDLRVALQPVGAPEARLQLTGALAAPTRALDDQDLVTFLAARAPGATAPPR
jgi:uncharacterized protein involved in outer membrane biogenesis